jgi:hypothetical protein
MDPIASSPSELLINVSGCVRGDPDFAPVVVTSPTLPMPMELSRPRPTRAMPMSRLTIRWRSGERAVTHFGAGVFRKSSSALFGFTERSLKLG